MNSAVLPKSDLRNHIRDILKTLTPEIKKTHDEIINQKLIAFFQNVKESFILSFKPLQIEPDISYFNEYIRHQNKLCWPHKEEVVIYPDSSDSPIPAYSELSYVVVPALAVTRHGTRLGKGSGWYDRLLANVNAIKICPIYTFQVIDSIPQFAHDQMVDIIVTESEIIKTKSFEEKAKIQSI
jgi:5-formyltetrahydrofolate cyclo-ligase